MAECSCADCCVGVLTEPLAGPCIVVLSPLLWVIGLILTIQCSPNMLYGPYILIAGAVLCGLLILMLYSVQKHRSAKGTIVNTGINSRDCNKCHSTRKHVHITVSLCWLLFVIPSIIASVVLLETAECFNTTWKPKKCEIIDIEETACSSFFGGDGFYYQYILEPEDNDCKSQCIYDDSNGYTDCEQSRDHSVGDSIQCWVYYSDDECMQCSCSDCQDGLRGAAPAPIVNPSDSASMAPTRIPIESTLSPTATTIEWKAQSCVVTSINTTDCVIGDLYQYQLEAFNCTSSNTDCVYDDSNGGTDCELSATHSLGEHRECWVRYIDGICDACDCANCSDDSRGDSPL